MEKIVFGLALLLVISAYSIESVAQTVSYNDVLVIINDASSISDSVGTYFVNARHIPTQNIVRITASTAEEIDNQQFENLRQQIETVIIARNLQDSINYIVTTKGVPLKVLRSTSYANSSVESELSLILGPYASYIGYFGKVPSPYYKKRENFTRASYGFYIVTRLDGYTYNDIKGLIDRASVTLNSFPQNGRFILDIDPLWTSTLALNRNMRYADDSLRSRGICSTLDTTTTFLTDNLNVLGYVSFGSNDHNCQLTATNAIPRNTYLPGAIAETYVSTSARSFAVPPIYGQSLIADLIAEGITAVKGYVYEPYSNAMADVSTLFSMYVDGFTIGESYYSSSPFLSWMDVIIGDPKFRLVSTRIPADTSDSQSRDFSALPVELTSFTTSAEKNGVILNWRTATETNCYGFDVERRTISPPPSVVNTWKKIGFVSGHGTSNIQNSYNYIDENINPGNYIYRLKQIDNNGLFVYYGNSEIDIVQQNKRLVLYDNFPNPFNPSTIVSFTVAKEGMATVCIYNILGQIVTTLYHQVTTAGVRTQITFNASEFPSGIYFARLVSNNQSIVKRMILTK